MDLVYNPLTIKAPAGWFVFGAFFYISYLQKEPHMLRNYLKIAWRNLRKHKLFSFINVFGLALSLSVCLVVLVQVKDDLSYDNFHPHTNRTYRVLSRVAEHKNKKQYTLASTPLPLAEALAQQTNVVEASVQIYPALQGKALYGEKELQLDGAFTDASFFTVFDFKLAAGQEGDALTNPNDIVLSSETAYRFFGTSNPLGKLLQIENLGTFQVTGVLEKPAGKSHLDFDAYASAATLPQLEKAKALLARIENWNTLNNAYTYVLLKENTTAQVLDKALHQIALNPALRSPEGTVDFTSQPLSKITPGTDGVYNEIGHGTVWAKLLTVVGVALLILIAACFNYTNLTVARALTRAKEVGIRKVAGATRAQIFMQYIIEAVLLALLALAFAALGLAQFKKDLHFDASLILVAILFTLFTGFIAGALPAWILSSFKPVNVLKNVATQKLFGNLTLQKCLMVFQFSLSLLILIFLTTYYRQFSFLKQVDTGFATKNIITVPLSSNSALFQNEVARLSGVKRLARTSDPFGIRGSGSLSVFLEKPTGNEALQSEYYNVDAGIVPMHHLQMIAGANFPENVSYTKETFVLINEKAAEAFGFGTPAAAVGKSLWLNDSTEVMVYGVLKNFYDKGAARNIAPLVLRNHADGFNYLNIEVQATAPNAVAQQIETIWNKLHPHTPFEYEWLDKKIAQREDQSDAYAIMGFLAFITVSIAALGLLGLVVYTVETRQKEISIRKVIGASMNQLLLLLSKGFLRLLLVAGAIALPLGYAASFFFLQNFANRVSVGLGVLLLCFLFLLLLGLVTILSNTYKAAAANPAKHLRSE